MAWEGRVGLFARLTGWNPSGLPRSLPRQRRKTRRGPPDPPPRSPEPPLRKSSQGTRAPALQNPVVPLSPLPRQRNHDLARRARSRSRGSFVALYATREPRPPNLASLSIPWFLCCAWRDKGTTTWGTRGAFVPLELSERRGAGAFVPLELLAHGAGGAWSLGGDSWGGVGCPSSRFAPLARSGLGAAGGDTASQASEEGHPTPPRQTPSYCDLGTRRARKSRVRPSIPFR